jgi:hypothetical protein
MMGVEANINKNTGTPLDASKEDNLYVNAEKTKHKYKHT